MSHPDDRRQHESRVGGNSDGRDRPFEQISVADRIEVLDELARYSWTFDEGDLEGYLARFHPDATFQHPLDDGTPWIGRGVEEIREFLEESFHARPNQTFGFQHQFSSAVLDRDGDDIALRAYVCVMRHEFHRTLWPHGPSWRQGTWHAVYGRGSAGWRLRSVDVRMWTGSAFSMGTGVSVGRDHLGAQ